MKYIESLIGTTYSNREEFLDDFRDELKREMYEMGDEEWDGDSGYFKFHKGGLEGAVLIKDEDGEYFVDDILLYTEIKAYRFDSIEEAINQGFDCIAYDEKLAIVLGGDEYDYALDETYTEKELIDIFERYCSF